MKTSLKGQRITGLYRSSTKENWPLLETDQACFELRLGGLKVSSEKRPQALAVDLPVLNQTIKALKTDEFALYFELENGTCLVYSNTSVDGDGSIDFEFNLLTKAAFDEERKDWYDTDPDLREVLLTDPGQS